MKIPSANHWRGQDGWKRFRRARSLMSPFSPGPSAHSAFGRPRAGFTLIELLVVVAILGVLLALLIPAFSQMRASASEARCAGNLKQIVAAYLMRIGDENGKFPLSRYGEDGPAPNS